MQYIANPKLAPLTKAEAMLPYSKYYHRTLATPPQEVLDDIGDNAPMDPSLVIMPDRVNDLIRMPELPYKRGWCMLSDGSAYASATTPFPGCTPEALVWWFSWFPLENLRTKIWCPAHHQGLMLPEPVKIHMLDYSLSNKERAIGSFWYGMDTGMIGTPGVACGPGRIDIYPDAQYGVDPKALEETGSVIMCMASGSDIGTRCAFVHIGRPTDYGMELRSHFWFAWKFVDGKPMRSDFKPDPKILEGLASNQNIHLLEEYFQLAQILPELYRDYGNVSDLGE